MLNGIITVYLSLHSSNEMNYVKEIEVAVKTSVVTKVAEVGAIGRSDDRFPSSIYKGVLV